MDTPRPRRVLVVANRTVHSDGSYDQVIISTLPRRVSQWLRRDLPKRVESLGILAAAVAYLAARLARRGTRHRR